jgi:hypothetical protein
VAAHVIYHYLSVAEKCLKCHVNFRSNIWIIAVSRLFVARPTFRFSFTIIHVGVIIDVSSLNI